MFCFSSRSLLSAIEAHYKNPENKYSGEDNIILEEVTPYLETTGISDPLSKVPRHHVIMILLFVVLHAGIILLVAGSLLYAITV